VKKLYVVDNGGEYSSHAVAFVWEDPEEWDDLEGVLRLWDSWYEQRTKIVLTAGTPQWRDPEQCSRAADLFDPWNGDVCSLLLKRASRGDLERIWRAWCDDPPKRVEWQVREWPARLDELKRRIEARK
jgi:hypothetical protein